MTVTTSVTTASPDNEKSKCLEDGDLYQEEGQPKRQKLGKCKEILKTILYLELIIVTGCVGYLLIGMINSGSEKIAVEFSFQDVDMMKSSSDMVDPKMVSQFVAEASAPVIPDPVKPDSNFMESFWGNLFDEDDSDEYDDDLSLESDAKGSGKVLIDIIPEENNSQPLVPVARLGNHIYVKHSAPIGSSAPSEVPTPSPMIPEIEKIISEDQALKRLMNELPKAFPSGDLPKSSGNSNENVSHVSLVPQERLGTDFYYGNSAPVGSSAPAVVPTPSPMIPEIEKIISEDPVLKRFMSELQKGFSSGDLPKDSESHSKPVQTPSPSAAKVPAPVTTDSEFLKDELDFLRAVFKGFQGSLSVGSDSDDDVSDDDSDDYSDEDDKSSEGWLNVKTPPTPLTVEWLKRYAGIPMKDSGEHDGGGAKDVSAESISIGPDNQIIHLKPGSPKPTTMQPETAPEISSTFS